MDSALKPVLENYPKYFIDKQQCPSYVSMYTKEKNDVVMVYAKSKQTTIYSENITKGDNREREELDLTGSPLKLDLSLHMLDDTLISDEPQLWSKEEASHQPVAIEKAREIANLYNKSITQTAEDALPMWILINSSSAGKPLLLSVQSNSEFFTRGIVTYEDSMVLDDVDIDELVEAYAKQEGISPDLVSVTVDCKYLLSGISYSSSHNTDELLNAPHSGLTQLHCDWSTRTLRTPHISCKVHFYLLSVVSYSSSYNTDELLNAPHSGLTQLHCDWSTRTLRTPHISCKVHFEQEVIVGHLASPCSAIWKSVCALHNINQLLVDMTACGPTAVNLDTAAIRLKIPGSKTPNNSKRLNNLLNETETYAYTAECPAGGCICITDDTTTLKQCLSSMCANGSSNDFTYKLWDILRDCETAEELVTLLIQALKFISSGKIRPFIDANNKTYLSKLVLKLSRGHSQASKVLKNLRSSPPQALSLVAQVGTEKTMWEYTRVMSLLEHSFYIAGIWNTDTRTTESIEQINQTIQDMTISGGDFTLNPFESFSTAETSIRLDCESFYDNEDPHELTVDDFASLKKHGLVSEKKDANEVPLIADEIDISPWKNLLMKFAQVHVCLEHLARAEVCLRADFANLKPIVSRLLEHYVCDKSSVKTVGQLISDPVQKISMPIANNVVQDHLKKPAFWYRAEMSRKEKAIDMGIKRDSKAVYVYSQQPVFPPAVWQNIEPQSEEVAEVTAVGEEIKYYCTKYLHLSNKLRSKLTL
ncbi:RZZ complex, subunit zwilch domain-containing protein [Phthorimaea operculella]|nr:RZZ complex, subunit zwilch domain-containing protein [Phthorimaea operculella]